VHLGELTRELVAARRCGHLDEELLVVVITALDMAQDHLAEGAAF
jgi:hypothetical protein